MEVTAGIFYSLYEVVVSTLFGAVELLEWQEIMACVISSIGAIFVFALPFYVVWKVIALMFSWR